MEKGETVGNPNYVTFACSGCKYLGVAVRGPKTCGHEKAKTRKIALLSVCPKKA
jgi:hypothetical protein